jgi:hypothetical protein
MGKDSSMPSSRALLRAFAWIAGFVAVALAADVAMTALILRSNSVEAGRVGRVIYKSAPREIPIFGASKVTADYRPDVLGPDFYNYGFASASPAVSNYLLGFETKKTSDSPIIVDIHQGRFADIGDPRNYLPFIGYDETRSLLEKAGQWRWYYAIPGLRYFGSYDWYVKGILTDYFQTTKIVSQGYVRELNALPWNQADFDANVQRRLTEPLRWQMDDEQMHRFMDLIKATPGRTFVIVLSPLHKSFYVGATGETAFREKMQAFLALPNVKLIDFSHVDYPDSYFVNTGHLNYTGAGAFSAQLRERLRQIGIVGG